MPLPPFCAAPPACSFLSRNTSRFLLAAPPANSYLRTFALDTGFFSVALPSRLALLHLGAPQPELYGAHPQACLPLVSCWEDPGRRSVRGKRGRLGSFLPCASFLWAQGMKPGGLWLLWAALPVHFCHIPRTTSCLEVAQSLLLLTLGFCRACSFPKPDFYSSLSSNYPIGGFHLLPARSPVSYSLSWNIFFPLDIQILLKYHPLHKFLPTALLKNASSSPISYL